MGFSSDVWERFSKPEERDYKVKKCPSVTSAWQVRFPPMLLKHSSFNLFEDAVLELNCKSSFLYCT